jgi:hypothetical protein
MLSGFVMLDDGTFHDERDFQNGADELVNPSHGYNVVATNGEQDEDSWLNTYLKFGGWVPAEQLQESMQKRLTDAARDGDVKRLQRGIEKQGSMPQCALDTALRYACAAGQTKCVRFLLANGADMHACSHDKQTALAMAIALNDTTDCLDALLEHKNDALVKLLDETETVGMVIRACVGFPWRAETLVKHMHVGPERDAFLACWFGDVAALNKVRVSCKETGVSDKLMADLNLLQTACASGQPECVKVLLDSCRGWIYEKQLVDAIGWLCASLDKIAPADAHSLKHMLLSKEGPSRGIPCPTSSSHARTLTNVNWWTTRLLTRLYDTEWLRDVRTAHESRLEDGTEKSKCCGEDTLEERLSLLARFVQGDGLEWTPETHRLFTRPYKARACRVARGLYAISDKCDKLSLPKEIRLAIVAMAVNQGEPDSKCKATRMRKTWSDSFPSNYSEPHLKKEIWC